MSLFELKKQSITRASQFSFKPYELSECETYPNFNWNNNMTFGKPLSSFPCNQLTDWGRPVKTTHEVD